MTHLVFDFDGTIITCETLDVVAGIALRDHPDAEEIRNQIAAITALGMEGKIPFRESLGRRLALVSLTREHIEEVTERLKGCVSESFVALKDEWQKRNGHVHVISNGFQEVIEPVLAPIGITPAQIHASHLTFDEDGNVTGVEESMLLEDGGKGKMLVSLGLGEDVVVVGDGYTDFLMKDVGGARAFVAYTEHVRREPSVAVADYECQDFRCVLNFADSL